MNKREQKALALYRKGTQIDTSSMTLAELRLRARQQDRLYRLAWQRLDNQVFGRAKA